VDSSHDFISIDQSLAKLIGPINDEAGYWLRKGISGETQLKAYSLIVSVISGTATRMLGGAKASRDLEWLESAAKYSYDVVATAQQLRQFSPFLRPFVAPWMDGKKKLDGHLDTAKKTFRHIFVQRLEQLERGGIAEEDRPVDMAQWMAESAHGKNRDPDVLAQNMLFMTLAGIHTSSNTTIHALFDLCANRQFIEPLREEIEQVISEHGWSMVAVSKLQKLDSFIKESQRLNQTVLSKCSYVNSHSSSQLTFTK
jgi:ent-kaurene oxidase